MSAELVRLDELMELARSAERGGEFDIALAMYERALAQVRYQGSSADAAMVFRWIGTLHRRRGNVDLAEAAYHASEAIAVVNKDDANLASALNCLGILAQSRARMDEAEKLYQRARDLATECNDERLAAMIDQNLGTIANIRGDVQAAVAAYRSALVRFQALNDEVATVWSLNNLGMAYVDLKDWESAAACFDRAFAIAESLADAELLGTVELNRIELYVKKQEFQAARESCDLAFEIFSRIDSRGHLGEACKFYGVIFRELQRSALATSHFEQAMNLAAETEDRLLEAETQAEWALLDLANGNNRGALQRLNRAHQLFSELHASADLMDLDGRLDKLEETYLKVMQGWAESIESKDRYTAGHCERVADYACMLAEHCGFEGRDLTWFRMGAYLHDVGKIAVPTEVLNKAGKLTDEEWALMQGHTTVGDEIVSELNFPWDIRPLVRNHHERWDGTGYPDKLAAENIPFTARILCVADVYDALTTARSYRPALPREEALRIMKGDAGRILDPSLFSLFCTLLQERDAKAA